MKKNRLLGIVCILMATNYLCADDLTDFVWSGGIQARDASIVCRLKKDSPSVRLEYSASENFSKAVLTEAKIANTASNLIVRFVLNGLQPSTQYYYRIQAEGVSGDRVGTFTTHAEGAFSFKFAVSSCAETGSTSKVFDHIREQQPLFYMNVGDLHYRDIKVDDKNLFRDAYNTVLASSRQNELYRSIPIVYMWDDHDFGGNNSDGSSISKNAAQLTYREYVPHYPLVAGDGAYPIYQAFTVGRVRFILTDLRSEKSEKDLPDAKKTMLGIEQKSWFKNEILTASQTHALVIWVNTVPWIAKAESGEDHWAGSNTERAELANYIYNNKITNLLMLSGDSHMVALDDGTNNIYNDLSSASFPVFHTAALDRPGSEKGGPYSHGTFPGSGQYGVVEIVDTGGNTVKATCTGYDSSNGVIISYSMEASKNAGDDPNRLNLLDIAISSGVDDVEEYQSDGTVRIDSTDIELVRDDSGLRGNMHIGLRFNNVVIPPDALVTSAYIQFKTDETGSEETQINIYAEDSVNPGAFTDNKFDVSNRNKTDIFVNWPVDPWLIVGEQGLAQQSADISALLNHLVNKEGWRSGNSINFIVTGTGKRTAESYDKSRTGAARLMVAYLPRMVSWRLNNFGTSENSGIAADDADPDNDGMSNFLEYAFNTDPNNGASFFNTEIEVNSDSLNLSFTRIADPSLTYEVLASNDLETWTRIWMSQGDENRDGTVVVDEIQDPAVKKRFFRIKISR